MGRGSDWLVILIPEWYSRLAVRYCIDESFDSNQMIHNKSLLVFQPHAVGTTRSLRIK